MITEGYFFLFFLYVVTPHLNCLIKAVQLRCHNIYFNADRNYLSLLPNTPASQELGYLLLNLMTTV